MALSAAPLSSNNGRYFYGFSVALFPPRLTLLTHDFLHAIKFLARSRQSYSLDRHCSYTGVSVKPFHGNRIQTL